MPGTLHNVDDNAITESDRSSGFGISTNMTTFTVSPDRAPTATESNTVYIVVGGVLFLLIVIVVLGVFAGLSLRRMKHINSITTQAEMKSNFKLDILESPNHDTIPSERVSEDVIKPYFTRLSISSSSLKPMPVHPGTTVQDSAEQLYTCPIMSNVCEPGATLQAHMQ